MDRRQFYSSSGAFGVSLFVIDYRVNEGTRD
jgi:hypothetical protein